MTGAQMLLLTIGLPFIGAIGIGLSGRWPKLREAITLITASAVCVLVKTIHADLSAGTLFAVDVANAAVRLQTGRSEPERLAPGPLQPGHQLANR